MKPRILIIDLMHECIVDGLLALGFDVEYRPEIKKEEVAAIIPPFHGLILRSKLHLTSELIQKAVNLKFIARAGAGVDEIDPNIFQNPSKKIHLINAPEGNRDALAEHALGLLLGLLNHIPQGNEQIKNGIWDREGNRGTEIMGKTIGLIGYGNMGEALARRLSGFSCRVITYDKYKAGSEWPFAEKVDLKTLKKETDILSIHVPLTSETRGMVNREFLEEFEKSIFLMNTSRGEVLPLKDLLILIGNGKVRGAALDVLENEKFDKLSTEQKEVLNSLFDTQKVIFSPHVGGWSVESYKRISEVLVEKIDRISYDIEFFK